MDIKEFSELERRYEQAKTNRAIGAFIGGGGVFALLADFLWDVANPISIGVLIGGGLVFCCMPRTGSKFIKKVG
ncbi:hypothetical protein AB2E84_12560 [Escherichia coli]